MPPSSERGIPRRSFVKAAVAIGGSAALSACLEREANEEIPPGPTDLSTLPERQHAWNEYLATDAHGNVVAPKHRVLLFLDYTANGTPSQTDRETMETALQTLERAYARSNNGLLFTVSYSPAYFDRYETDLPEAVDLSPPKALAPFEDPEFDTPDAVIHLASDQGSIVLAAEEALFGNTDTINETQVAGSLDSVFDRIDRRTGFVGNGLPASNQNVDGIPNSEPVPEDSPLYMGFKSGFKKNQATEDAITIEESGFSGGTTQQISLLRLHLQQWYEQDSRYHRVATMFCPAHAENDIVEGTGENLGNTSQMEESGCPMHTEDHAREFGVVGHSQKSARARREGSPRMIRRDFNSTDDGNASLHFLSLQRSIEDFFETRRAMNGTELAENAPVGQRTNNGILQYLTVKRRGNFLVPPRALRAFPHPQP